MIVVDSIRFPYIDGTGTLSAAGPVGGPPNVPYATANTILPNGTSTANPIYSVQRFQPYRGGHAVPIPGTATPPLPIDTRYGFSEQIVVPSPSSQALNTAGVYYYSSSTSGTTTTYTYYYATEAVYHTLGWANEFEQGSTNPLAEDWNFFQFHDRDFTSVAELMLVPGCAPGLFTKQFVEFAPSYANITNIFGGVSPDIAPHQRPCDADRTDSSRDCACDSPNADSGVRDRVHAPGDSDGLSGQCHATYPADPAAHVPLFDRQVLLLGVRAIEHARPGWSGRRLRG